MGVALSSIVPREQKKINDFSGKIIAIDAYNTLYQFLSIIRQPDGMSLKNSEGRITSHLAGILYRNANLIELGIFPIYVFDGKPHILKKTTIEYRSNIREKAAIEWQEALEKGEIEKARVKAMQSTKLTKEDVDDAKELLKYLGIPVLQAKSEGEALASYLSQKKEVDAISSQDYDSLLFGASVLVRYLAITGRKKLIKKHEYTTVYPEEIKLQNMLNKLNITREQLVDIGILVGTDYNEGIKGIGPKKSYALIKKYCNLETVLAHLDKKIEYYEEIRNIFLKPEIDIDYNIKLQEINESKVKEFMCEKHDFLEERVEKAIEKIKKGRKEKIQKRIDEYI